jgi:hypothetical protein
MKDLGKSLQYLYDKDIGKDKLSEIHLGFVGSGSAVSYFRSKNPDPN